MRFGTIVILFGCLPQTTFASRFGRKAFLNFHRNADQKRNTASQKTFPDIFGKSIWKRHNLRKKPEFNNTLPIITSKITTKLKSGIKIKSCQLRFLSQMNNTVISLIYAHSFSKCQYFGRVLISDKILISFSKKND